MKKEELRHHVQDLGKQLCMESDMDYLLEENINDSTSLPGTPANATVIVLCVQVLDLKSSLLWAPWLEMALFSSGTMWSGSLSSRRGEHS